MDLLGLILAHGDVLAYQQTNKILEMQKNYDLVYLDTDYDDLLRLSFPFCWKWFAYVDEITKVTAQKRRVSLRKTYNLFATQLNLAYN